MTPPHSPRPVRRWSRRTAAIALAVSATTAGLPLATAQAVSKESLWSLMKASSYDYAATKPVWGAFPSADRAKWSSSFNTATTLLTRVRARLNAADTQSEVDAVAPLVKRERTRARTFRITTSLGSASFSARTSARSVGQQAFSDQLASSITPEEYAERRADSAAVAALAANDKRRAMAALGGLTPPAASQARAAVPALSNSDRVSMPSGWVAVPGGCAVPAASSAWIGTAGQPGRHLWVDEAQIAAAQARVVTGSDLAREADRKLRVAADRLKAPLTTDLANVYTPLKMRTSRLGYEALMGDTEAMSWLQQDLQAAMVPGPQARNPLRDAISMEALATDLDWTGLDSSGDPNAATLREALLVRWLGPQSCRFDDRESAVVANNNYAIVNDVATFHAALALASAEPVIAAGLARAAIGRLMLGLTAMTADGGSFEGPSYWNLQTRYLGAFYGTAAAVYGDNPPLALPSPDLAASYAWNSVAPDGSSLTFADTAMPSEALRPGLVSWVAHRTGLPEAGALARQSLVIPTEGLQLLWYPSDEAVAAATPARRSVLFRRTGLAALQSPEATAWLRGGTSKEGHAHLDLGTVGYFKHGIHWAVDPGQDDYSLPGYSSSSPTSKRWTYWKVASKGHTTLRPAAGQPPLKATPYTAFSPTSRTARLDLRSVMPGATGATRTVVLSDTGVLSIRDRVTSATAKSWVWGWVTDADVTISGTGSSRMITLSRDGKSVRIALGGLPARSTVAVLAGPSSAVGPTGRPLRAVTVTLGPTTSLALSATVA